ncbi:DoxX family protein [Tenacibaculum retecalamus]|uniref:DoxX family protein n=1 Tax=Tenacibaculum retecalamus TaxID=3018315 RepID=UPI0023D90652|nr:DoxX family protein [Tenacibaculum retecalamus]WBX70476.1 DoxX family protein [Tenacibaculum retecalamus]
MKRDKIIFYVTTGLLTVMMLMSAGMYFFNNVEVSTMFEGFGYPSYIIYPYGVVKILGLIALWFFRGKFLNEWAYAGFFFAFILAFFAHVMIGDGEQFGAGIAMVLLITSYVYSKKI